MNDPVILAIDNGTQSVRALLFDLAGNVIAKSQVELEPYFSEQPGWAEQNPDYYWESLTKACQGLWQDCTISKDQIVGVGLTTQRSTLVNVDRDGQPLRPAIVWLDQRSTDDMPAPKGIPGLLSRIPKVRDAIRDVRSECEAHWIQRHQPDIWAKTHKYLLLSGFLTYRLVGEFRDSTGCQPGYLPFDYRKHEWLPEGHWQRPLLEIEQEKLPELIKPGETLGNISAEASAATGIPTGLPLIACAADKACEILGAGCMTPEVGNLSYGTTATVNTVTSRYLEVKPFRPVYPAATPNSYHTEIQIYRGYWMVSWFKREFGLRESQLADERGIAAESLFDKLIQDVPPGSMGLMLQPYWTAGAHEPGPEAKGAVIGFGDVHTRAHLYRAILEGLAYALREGKELTEKKTGVSITELRVSGGGSQSDAAMQLTADIFNLPASRPHTFETSGLGAAMDVAVGLGLHADFETAAEAMTRLGDVFMPNPAAVEVYEKLYRQVYQCMYKQLKPLYEDIREITGYPA